MMPPNSTRSAGSSRSEDLPDLEAVDEPDQLAKALRNNRLSVLFGGPPSVRAEWIRGTLLPQLGRRTGDRLDPGSIIPRVQLAFADRRNTVPSGRGQVNEVAVFFDGWNGDALGGFLKALDAAVTAAAAEKSTSAVEPGALARAISEASAFGDPSLDSEETKPISKVSRPPLSERTRQVWPTSMPPVGRPQPPDDIGRGRLAIHVGRLAARHGVRFLVILEQFDECFHAMIDTGSAAGFVENLVEMLNQHASAAHVLVTMRPSDEPMFHALCNRIRDCGGASFHLV